jgi:protein-S-isoprenylcysteine O-methyltransferase Ste14
MNKLSFKQHLLSSLAGLFSIAQLIMIFFLPGGKSDILRIIGWILWATSMLFAWLPIYHLKRYGGVKKGKGYVHTQQLVNQGIYGVIRHPQYLSLPLFNIGLMLISQHWIITVLGIPAILLMIPDIHQADHEGLEKFGDTYREYTRQIPKLNFIVGIFRLLKRKFKQKK